MVAAAGEKACKTLDTKLSQHHFTSPAHEAPTHDDDGEMKMIREVKILRPCVRGNKTGITRS